MWNAHSYICLNDRSSYTAQYRHGNPDCSFNLHAVWIAVIFSLWARPVELSPFRQLVIETFVSYDWCSLCSRSHCFCSGNGAKIFDTAFRLSWLRHLAFHSDAPSTWWTVQIMTYFVQVFLNSWATNVLTFKAVKYVPHKQFHSHLRRRTQLGGILEHVAEKNIWN